MSPRTRLTCVASLLLAACGSPSGLYDAGDLDRAQFELLRRAEVAYRSDQPIDELLQEIVADPTASFWFTRMLVRDMLTRREMRSDSNEFGKERLDIALQIFQRQQRGSGPEQDLFDSLLKSEDPVEARAFTVLDAMGEAVLPCIVEDLARSRQTLCRRLGVELLVRSGQAARPHVEALSRSRVSNERRVAAQVVGEWPPGADVDPVLGKLLRDSDYAVRADSAKGLAGGGAAANELLRGVLASDEDAFVRRSAARALAISADKATVDVLVGYLERCLREDDSRGAAEAERALQGIAGSRGRRPLPAWQAWADSYEPDKDD
jgi:hypothetical protein